MGIKQPALPKGEYMPVLSYLKKKTGLKKIALVGLGKSNLGVLKYLKANFDNLEFTLRSKNQVSDLPSEISRLIVGEGYLDEIDEDVVFFSPSCRRDNIKGSFLASSDAELFLELCDKKKIIAISGSDGKSTTSSITHKLLLNSGIDATLCGNIGKSMCEAYLQKGGKGIFVIELSSFQLTYALPEVSRAAITNITPNHLNWHKDFDEYKWAKKRLLEKARDITLNFDCEETDSLLKIYKPRALFSVKLPYSSLSSLARDVYTLENNYILKNEKRVLDIRNIKINGIHNIKNYMCAISLCEGLIKNEAITNTAKSFEGLLHRQRVIYDRNGIRVIDSSIDSSPMRTKATLEALSSKAVVILGGSDKGLDYSILTPVLLNKASTIVFTGANMLKMLTQIDITRLKSAGIHIFTEQDFDVAVALALSNVRVGECLILSPASASYDSFSSFEKRGEKFKDIVLCELSKNKEVK